MRWARLAWTMLWARPMVAVLNLCLLSLGVAAMVFVVVASEQLETQVQRSLKGIDLVVGAKGSPLQLILAGVFHLDSPTGNIPLEALKTVRAHPLVAQALPLSLGDSLQGFRIVGTEAGYVALYGGQVAEGALWSAPMQAVLGAAAAEQTGLRTGQRFAGSHGLGDGGQAHAHTPYLVAGVLAPCGCVLDRLVLTSLESVWQVHEHGHGAAGAAREPAHEAHADHDDDEDKEVTLLLVTYRSPLAAVSLPRWVNAQAGLQAAAPALESARLMRMLGVGVEVLRGFGLVLLAVAAMSVFIALTHAVRDREPDLAMLRMLGASPWRVAALPSFEALWLAGLGLVAGLALGLGLVELLGWALKREQSFQITGLWWSAQIWWVIAGTFVLAWLAALVPSWRTFRLDVTRLLQSPR